VTVARAIARIAMYDCRDGLTMLRPVLCDARLVGLISGRGQESLKNPGLNA